MNVYIVTANAGDRNDYSDSTFQMATDLRIFECVLDANCWKYVGGYAE